YHAAMQAECGERPRKLLDSSETRQRRGGKGSPAAPHDQVGHLRTGNAAQEYILIAAQGGVLGERLHEINSLNLVLLRSEACCSIQRADEIMRNETSGQQSTRVIPEMRLLIVAGRSRRAGRIRTNRDRETAQGRKS